MIKERKIGLIGRVDPQETMFDGQTVKTRTLWRMLCKKFGAENVLLAETLNYRREPLRVLFEYRKVVHQCDDIIVLLSHNGRKLFFPLLKREAERHGKRIYHDLIGCWLERDLQREPWLADQLRSFTINWIESPTLVQRLNDLGIQNCEYLPNFKQIKPLAASDLLMPSTKPRRLCTFSRVVEQKGILDAVEAVQLLNNRDGDGAWTLDIFGPVDVGFRDSLEEALECATGVKYSGVVKPEDSVEAIKGYWALLFPTKWKLEGIPGTIIDALAAGVPVVASRWQYYGDMLKDGYTGSSYKLGSGSGGLVGAIDQLVANENSIMTIKKNCLEQAKSYSADSTFKKMLQTIEIHSRI